MISAREKLNILLSGKATLKEINELEQQAENEPEVETPVPQEDETPVTPEIDVSEFETRIAELEKANEDLQAKLYEAQNANVIANNDVNTPSFDEQLESMFNDFRIN